MRPLAFVNGFVTLRGVKIYSQEKAMALWKITRPTYYKWVKDGRIRRTAVAGGAIGLVKRWGVSDDEIKRVNAIIKDGWVRGKSKMPKAVRR